MKKVRDNMIEFIILEDELIYVHKYKKIIDKVMMNYDINYNLSIYDNYNKNINKFLKNDNFKVYILCYSNTKNTLEMIKYIREKLDDWESLIIIIYKDKKDKEKLIKESMFIVDYINKDKSIAHTLTRSLQICLKNYDRRPNSLRYSYKNVIYNIEFKRILYIEKEQDNKRCIIKTLDKDYYIPGSIKQIYNMLDKRFIKASRSYIINLEQISTYDIKNNIITFNNNIKLNAVSRNNKKDIVNYLRMM